MNKNRIKKEVKEWVEALLIALVLAVFVRTFFIEAFKIPTGSMRPTLIEGDHIIVNKFIYGAKIPFTKNIRLPGFSEPKRGDVIVFLYPEDKKKNFIKRLIALSGETVEIRGGKVSINGKELSTKEFQNKYYYNRGAFEDDNFKLIVPESSYFVLGDNSGSSKDSRYWGFVPKDHLVGQANLIYWPLWRIKLIE
ncbi:MAG: signal peptidase I [Candidatus Gygaella obscura]|nr:signal peptidase I [Candidatus Gygaella obscura]